VLELLLMSICAVISPTTPGRLVIKTNVIQAEGEEIQIEIYGVQHGTSVIIEVGSACGNTATMIPDLDKQCSITTVIERTPPSVGGIIQTIIDPQAHDLPKNRVLWMRARNLDGAAGRPVMFGISHNPCGILETILSTFLGGDCDPDLARIPDPLR